MTNNKNKEINKNNQKDSARLARIRRLEQQLKANILKRKKVKKHNG